MNRISSFVVEDHQKSLDLILYYLKNYFDSIEVVGSATNVEEAIKEINLLAPQLLFLDVEIADSNAFELIQGLCINNFRIIFVSSYSKYAIDAFKHNALDYILKPLELKDLITAVHKATLDISRNRVFKTSSDVQEQLDFIPVTSMHSIDFIKFDNIIYLKASGKYTTLILNKGAEIVSSKNLGEFEDMLTLPNFKRIHNSYIVNVTHIERIVKKTGRYCLMTNNDYIPISKRRMDDFNSFLNVK